MMSLTLCRAYGYLLTISLVGIVLVFLTHRSMNVAQVQRILSTGGNSKRFADETQTAIVRSEEFTATTETGKTTTDPKPTTSSEKRQGPIPVIILTYMRSGSSFTGQILQAAPSAFYWFEPMHKLLRNFTPNIPFRFLNGESREFLLREDIASQTARNIISCQLNQLPLDVLTDGFLSHGNEKTSYELMSCLASFRKLFSDHISALRRCIPGYKEVCLRSKHIIIKTIRMKMSSMGNLLENFPQLKVLHLMRDPRGTVRSQKRYGGFHETTNETEAVENFCRTVLRDVLDREDLQRRFPNRLMSVFYEDIAKNPIVYSRKLYQFLGMEFTSESEKRILDMTSSGIEQKKCGALCTNRSNSSEEAYQWRHEIDINFVKMVDKMCIDLYNKVGYNAIPNKTALLDLQYPLRY